MRIAASSALTCEGSRPRGLIPRRATPVRADAPPGVTRGHGAAPGGFADEMGRLAPLIDDGICTVDDSRVTVTEMGRPFVRLVAAAFDAYLTAGEQCHSRAV